MTNKERAIKILNRQNVDRPVYFDCIANDAVIEHYAGAELTFENAEDVIPKAYRNFLESTRWIIILPQKEKTITHPNGLVVEQKRWTGWHKYPLNDVDDAKRYIEKTTEELCVWGREQEEMVKSMEENYFRWKDRLDNTFLFGNFLTKNGVGVYGGMGLELFSYLYADYPEVLQRYFDASTEFAVRIVNALKRTDEIPVVFVCDDMAYKEKTVFSLNFLRKEFFPRLEKIIDAYHSRGVKFIFHSDGNIMPMIDDLVAIGIDGINPLETIAGVDVKELRRKYPDLILIGGVDCSQILPNGAPKDVRKETARIIKEGAPWIFAGSSSETHNSIPLDNVKAMIDTIREYRY